MQPYTVKEIKQYYEENKKLDLFEKYSSITKNIGQIKIFLNSPYEDIIDYCHTIVNMIPNVAQGNIFNITNKLNLDNGVDKWNITLFLNILEWTLYNYYVKTKEEKYFQSIFMLISLRRQLKINGVNKQCAVDNFLLGLKDTL